MASESLPGLPSHPSPSYLREYNGDTLRNVAYTFIFFVIAIVALRFYARTLSKSKIGADDLLLIPGCLCSIGLCILSLVGKSKCTKSDSLLDFLQAELFCSFTCWLHRPPCSRYQSGLGGHRLQGVLILFGIAEGALLIFLLGIDRLPIAIQLRRCIRQDVHPSILPEAFPHARVSPHRLSPDVQHLRLMLLIPRHRRIPMQAHRPGMEQNHSRRLLH